MSSEHNLWTRIRTNIGHRGHFVRMEFNPEAGIPDVDYCIKGTEGKIELKHTAIVPARANTAVFTNGGLRDAQIAWIYTRVRHGGRVWILSQIGELLYIVHGDYCRQFNRMTLHQIEKASAWASTERQIPAEDWNQLLAVLAELQ
jgi:hypothetical protein